MVRLTIRCYPSTPVPPAELEDWLKLHLDGLRADQPRAIIRLSRLTQELPRSEIDGGWLIELELPEESVVLGPEDVPDTLAETVTDMLFLGLQPTLLSSHDLSVRSTATGDSRCHAADGWKVPSTSPSSKSTIGP